MDGKRNTGIDLLRIVSMCMIIIIHMNGYGKASEMIDAFSLKYYLSQALVFFVACSVNIYAMISGFVSSANIVSGNRIGKFLRLWVQVFFYSVVLMLVFKSLYPYEINRHQMIESFFPAMSMQYWYFTYYIPVLFLMPYLNLITAKLDIVSMRKLIVILFLIFSFVPWVFQTDWFGLDGGFSAFWLIILYLFGAWLKKETQMEESMIIKCKRRLLVFILVGLILLQIVIRYMLDRIGEVVGAQGRLMHDFGNYTSPFIVLEACVLLILFMKVEVAGGKCSILISKIGAASFGVYLIHDNQFVRNYVMMDSLKEIGQMSPLEYVLAMLGTAIGIYVFCTVVEMLRKFIGCNIRNVFILIRRGM